MINTREQWYRFCIERGTSGNQVFDILKDWKESNEKQVALIESVENFLERNRLFLESIDRRLLKGETIAGGAYGEERDLMHKYDDWKKK